MDTLLLQPRAILALSQGLLALCVALYLLRFKRKARASRWLGFTFSMLTLVWVQLFIEHARTGPRLLAFDWSDSLFGLVLLFGLLNFSYAFLGDVFPRESKRALYVTAAVLGMVTLGLGLCLLVWGDIPVLVELGVEALTQMAMLWMAGVFFRKKQHFEPVDEGGIMARLFVASGKEARALRAFALYALALPLLPLIAMWDILGEPPPILFALWALGWVLGLGAVVVLYIDHGAEPTTVQVKLIGLAMAIVLGVLGLAPLALYVEADLVRASWARLPDVHTLRLHPDGNQGYAAVRVPLPFDPVLGDDLDLEVEGDTLVALGFTFPFYGTRWDSLFVDANGLVSFGGAYQEFRFDRFLPDVHPKIAPYYRAIIPKASANSGVFFKTEDDKATISWVLVRERYSEDRTNRNSFQLVLHADGTIDFVYDRLEARLLYGFRGLRPGGREEPTFSWNALLDIPQAPLSELLLPEGQTIRFEPRSDSTYHVTRQPSRFDADLGEALRFEEATDPLFSFGFSFPFFGSGRTEAYVSNNGGLSFEASLRTPEHPGQSPYRRAYSRLPLIMPFFTDLDLFREGARVYARRAEDHVLITWDQMPVFGYLETNTVQLALYQDGTIDFTYAQINTTTFEGDLWGLYPGDGQPPVDAIRYLSETHAMPLPVGTVPMDDFGLLRDRTYRQYVHDQMLPFLYMIIASTLLLMVVFPLLCRTSLIKPLQALLVGVHRVDEGNLSESVPVRVNDEFGVLARNFNTMTASLKAAEQKLKAYAASLEDKVAERTEDLERSLRLLTEAQDQLIHAEKMASLGKLTAGIAHEIKNPLNFVNNFSQLSIELAEELAEEIEGNEDKTMAEMQEVFTDILNDLKVNAAKIREHGGRADSIVRSMLEHSRSGTGERRVIALNTLVEDFVNLAYHGMRAQRVDFNATVVQEYDEAIGEVSVIPQALGRVLINLLNNAFYAVYERDTETQGHSDAESAYAPTVVISTWRRGDSVEIRISDNGPGIPDDVQKKIFEPFFTTKPTGEGTGLGLSLSYDIITQGHGGTMTVKSTNGQGATFIITLPG